MKIKIESKLFGYLDEKIVQPLGLSFKSVEQLDSTFIIVLSEETAELIRDKAGDLLQTRGFDLDYNLTEDGEFLEEIIDIFYS